jgi:YD repeat-containing protein
MDVRVPGLGNGLALQRTWNSIWPSTISAFQTGMFGANWRSTYEERVFKNNNYMIYLRGDGGFWVFSQTGASTWNLISPASVIATLTQNGTQSWTIAFQNGEQRIFNYTSGSLSSIIDPNGNATQLIYDATNRLVTVTDPANRHLYFAYGNGSNNLLVTGVTSDAAQSWAYTYDSQNRLTVVTRPDQTTNTFVYNSQSLISQVLDSNGRVLEAHTYDASGRGATSSRANGVETVTVSYPN